MWTYEQATGRFSHDGVAVAFGYSGRDEGKNNPAMQYLQGIGPLPRGAYTIGDAVDTDTHGPCVMPLSHDASNEMFGRSGFLIHGDSIAAPGTASHGCIILPRAIRDLINLCKDRCLSVV